MWWPLIACASPEPSPFRSSTPAETPPLDAPPAELPSGWTLVASIYDASDYNWRLGTAVAWNGALHGVEKWDHDVVTLGGALSRTDWVSGGGGAFEESGPCAVGSKVYLLGGG